MKVTVSQHYQDKGDSVSYKVITKEGVEREWRDSACYHGILPQLAAYEIHCRPWNGKNSAPRLMHQRFFRELIDCGIIPPEAQVRTVKGENVLILPRQGWDRHTIFVALSLYRHADCHGKSILGRTMILQQRLHKEGVHFLQCLHWALCNTDYGVWHCCINLDCRRGPYEQNTRDNPGTDLKWGLALAVFGKMSLADRARQEKLSKIKSSTFMFAHLAMQLQDFKIKSTDEILDPKYAKYYRDPELARK